MRKGTFTNFPGDPGGGIHYWVDDCKRTNEYSNWWLVDSVCIQHDCNILIDNCDNDYNAGHANGTPSRIYRCPEHYRSESKKRTDRRESHPITGERRQNWKSAKAQELGGRRGEPGWEDKLYEAQTLWESDVKGHLLNTAPADEVLEFMFPETKESVVTKRTVNHKPRNQALVLALKELYNYTCQVEDCNETEVSLAHIYKHSLPDSVDNETNALCLCDNHHSAYDGDRLVLHPALDGRFIRYNRFGKVVEIGRIIYDEKHVIDVKWIKKARDYHDSKK